MAEDKTESCLLCGAGAYFFSQYRNVDYYRCGNCRAVFMPPAFHPSPEREKKRYLTHNNDVSDPGYRAFVRPLTDMVAAHHGPGEGGLDFGAGTGPVAADLLKEEGYGLELYDPFFCNNPEALQKKYDFIICCEVIEHFHRPGKEFRLLRSLLRPGGSLFCMTLLYNDDIDFVKWRYKDDETHVIFYDRESVSWIKTSFDFESARIDDRIIHFRTG